MPLQIWNYDPAKENMLIHAGDCFADPDPEEPGKFLIPAHATPVPCLPDQDGKTQHFDPVSSAWYFKDQPPTPQSEPEPEPDQQEVRRAEIDMELAQIDTESSRPAREIAIALAAGDAPPKYAVEKLQVLETRAANLRMERKGYCE